MSSLRYFKIINEDKSTITSVIIFYCYSWWNWWWNNCVGVCLECKCNVNICSTSWQVKDVSSKQIRLRISCFTPNTCGDRKGQQILRLQSWNNIVSTPYAIYYNYVLLNRFIRLVDKMLRLDFFPNRTKVVLTLKWQFCLSWATNFFRVTHALCLPPK